MSTNARIRTADSAHWYTQRGEPCFEIPKVSGDGMKSPTIADARKLNLLPSVTNILRILNRPELESWKTEQAVLAVLSSPRKEGESLDAFVHRILQEERVQDQESARARELGSRIHDSIELALNGKSYDTDLAPFVDPVVEWQKKIGRLCWTEKILVGDGYAGRGDALMENDIFRALYLVDFKTTGRLPKESYPEHRLQTSAYAATIGNTADRRILTGNVYISTKDPGKFVVSTQDNWAETYVEGFEPLLKHWQWAHSYKPQA